MNPHRRSVSGGSAVTGDETEYVLDSGYTRTLHIRTVEPHKTEATLAHHHINTFLPLFLLSLGADCELTVANPCENVHNNKTFAFNT